MHAAVTSKLLFSFLQTLLTDSPWLMRQLLSCCSRVGTRLHTSKSDMSVIPKLTAVANVRDLTLALKEILFPRQLFANFCRSDWCW